MIYLEYFWEIYAAVLLPVVAYILSRHDKETGYKSLSAKHKALREISCDAIRFAAEKAACLQKAEGVKLTGEEKRMLAVKYVLSAHPFDEAEVSQAVESVLAGVSDQGATGRSKTL